MPEYAWTGTFFMTAADEADALQKIRDAVKRVEEETEQVVVWDTHYGEWFDESEEAKALSLHPKGAWKLLAWDEETDTMQRTDQARES